MRARTVWVICWSVFSISVLSCAAYAASMWVPSGSPLIALSGVLVGVLGAVLVLTGVLLAEKIAQRAG